MKGSFAKLSVVFAQSCYYFFGCMEGCSDFSEAMSEGGISTQLVVAFGRIFRYEWFQTVGNNGWRHVCCNQFRYDFSIGNEVDQRDVRAFEEERPQAIDETSAADVVANDLRYTEESSFEGGRSTRDEGSVGVLQKREGGVSNEDYVFVFKIRSVVGIVDAWCGSQYRLCVPFGVGYAYCGEHAGQVGCNFGTA